MTLDVSNKLNFKSRIDGQCGHIPKPFGLAAKKLAFTKNRGNPKQACSPSYLRQTSASWRIKADTVEQPPPPWAPQAHWHAVWADLETVFEVQKRVRSKRRLLHSVTQRCSPRAAAHAARPDVVCPRAGLGNYSAG